MTCLASLSYGSDDPKWMMMAMPKTKGRGITERLARACAGRPRRTLALWGVAVLVACVLVATSLPDSTRAALRAMGYKLRFAERTSGPINAVMFDAAHHTMWGGSSNHGEDYGIAW